MKGTEIQPWLQDADCTLYHGDVLDVLRKLPAESVDCCVTSPPYWGLRSYLADGHHDKPLELGLEKTPEEYVTRMVEVFREVRRVLASHGTVWLNLGDSFNEKQLVGTPWRVAFALQQDGWYLRSDIVWSKLNPMPESVTDRPTKAHEYIFLLSKNTKYFWDQEAVREAQSPGTLERFKPGSAPRKAGRIGDPRDKRGDEHGMLEWAFGSPNGDVSGRNVRSVWSIATQPYPEAHFATFPEELARRCIAAGTSERGKCPECGAPWVRKVEKGEPVLNAWSAKGAGQYDDSIGEMRRTSLEEGSTLKHSVPRETVDWVPSCAPSCINGHKFRTQNPCVVLDPFIGSGTVAHVARKLGRHAVGIDLNEAYLELAARRLQQQSLFAEPLI